MKLKPLSDRIIVEPIEEEEHKKGGIIIPDTAKEKPVQGKIIAVGSGKLTDEGLKLNPEVQEGDRVLFGRFTGTEVDVNDKKLLVMRESDIYAVVIDDYFN